MLTRSSTVPARAHDSQTYEPAAEQQERTWLWHEKVKDRAAGFAVSDNQTSFRAMRCRPSRPSRPIPNNASDVGSGAATCTNELG